MLAINSIQCLVTLTYLFQSVALYSLPPSWNEKAVVDSQLIFQPLFEILNLILFEYSSVVYCQELPSSHHINQSIGWWLFCNKMEKFVQSSIWQVCRLTIISKYQLKSFWKYFSYLPKILIWFLGFKNSLIKKHKSVFFDSAVAVWGQQ